MEVEPSKPIYFASSEPIDDTNNDSDENQDAGVSYEHSDIDSSMRMNNQIADNKENLIMRNDNEPPLPIDIDEDNINYEKSYDGHRVYENKLPSRVPKKKKSKKGKPTKGNNISMSNRSSSAKWRKVDPYLQNAPQNLKNAKQLTKKQSSDDNGSGYSLPPINKQAHPEGLRNSNPKTYKPLGAPKMKKAHSIGMAEQTFNKNIIIDDNPDDTNKIKGKGNNVDFEKKNLERLQNMQAKKAQEIASMEEQRKKAQEEREKLRQIVFKRAEEHRKIREEKEVEERKRRELEDKLKEDKPK